jgi:D-arginine dehydrogenase
LREFDFLIVGSGIAGASAAYHLTDHGTVAILEREDQPGYHSTGRSAALYTPSYGPRLMRIFTAESGAFLHRPPAGFASHPLMTPRGALFTATADRAATLERFVAEVNELGDILRLVDRDEALRICPAIVPEAAALGALDAAVMDMDVNAIHHGYLRAARHKGAELVTRSEVQSLARSRGQWRAETPAGSFAAPVVINAAGAWADVVAGLAGVTPLGLTPKRRTVIIFDGPNADFSAWPCVADIAETYYFKPEAGRLLASPADETPVAPHDLQPEELDIAVLVDRLQQATTLAIPAILRRWAGLRSFVADKNPVIGFDPAAPGFFWLAGQGGYGIQTSWAIGLTAASLARGAGLPERIAAYAVTVEQLGPARLATDKLRSTTDNSALT